MKSLLVIGHGIPEPQSTGAGVRMMQLLDLFEQMGYAIHFCSVAQALSDSALANTNIAYTQIELNKDSFSVFVKNLKPDLVLYDRFITEEQFGWRVREQCPEAFTILDTEDLHFLRKGREQAIDHSQLVYQLNDIAKRELAAIYRCDLSLIISDFELKYLEQFIGQTSALLYHLPFLFKASKKISNLSSFDQREGFYFIGNGKHKPNLSAIKNLKAMWPELKKALPKATMNIYGAYLPQQILELHNKSQDFLVRGFVENLEAQLSKHRLLLAPLDFGAGQKRKVFDAWITGSPVVTTNIGAEGIIAKEDFGGVVCTTVAQQVQAAIKLYTSKSQWENAVAKGQQLLQTTYQWQTHKDQFATVLNTRIAARSENRQRNTVGQLLWHHSMQSSKYLSKFIQEKSRSKEPPAS